MMSSAGIDVEDDVDLLGRAKRKGSHTCDSVMRIETRRKDVAGKAVAHVVVQ
jgi:hypothetical protein